MVLYGDAAAVHEKAVVNAFSVDVEDYFQVSALAPYIRRQDWDSIPRRVDANVDRLLRLLNDTGNEATFFVLGWIADRHRLLIRRISEAGHEVANHGYSHLRVSDQSKEEFRMDVTRSKAIIEDLIGAPVLGYRAPSFSISPKTPWAHDVLTETGHRYSSSVYPIRHDHYGMPGAPRFAHRINERMIEIPPTAVRIGSRNVPAGGGGYFRLLPYSVSRWMIRRVNSNDQQPSIFYCHPWEIDPDQPRVPGVNVRTRFRHYVNLSQMEGKIRRLLADARWGRIDHIFGISDSASGLTGAVS